jgi:polar amino acid transport system substrate-binding protein
MKKKLVLGFITLTVVGFLLATSAISADIDLAKKSTIEQIIKRGELRVGFESGYVPFEMTNKKGEFIGFDMDYARRLAKDMGVKFVPINTA